MEEIKKLKNSKNKKATYLLKTLLYLTLISLHLGQLAKLVGFNYTKIYLFDALIIFYNLSAFIYLIKNKKLKLKPSLIFLFGFVFLGLISLIFTPLKLDTADYITSLGYALRFLIYILFLLFTYNLVRLQLVKTKNLYKTIIKLGVLVFLIGIVQLIFLPDLEKLDPSYQLDPHKNRMVSTFLDPNFLGMYFVICLFLCLRHQNLYNKKLQMLLIACFVLGIILTFSRSAWLCLIILLMFFGLKKTKVLIPTLIGAFFVLMLVPQKQIRITSILDPQDSAAFRIVSWNNTLKIIKENWVFGVGYNAFRYAQIQYGFLNENDASKSGAGSDSSFLLVWATSGILGLIFFASYFFYLLAKNYKIKDYLSLGLIFALLTNSVFINSLFYPQIITTFLIAIEIKNGGH